MPGTVGELREALKELGEHAWPIAAHLKDTDEIPEHALGADLGQLPLAVDVPAVDFKQVLEAPVPSPLLRARRLQVTQMRVMDQQAAPPSTVDWRDRWGGRWLATIQDQNPCESCWAFGATALAESMVRIEHGVWAKRSEGDLRDGWGGKLGEDWRKRDGVAPCAHGAGVNGALDWIVANGIADPDCFPWASSDQDYAPSTDRPGRVVRVAKYEPLGNVTDQKRWLDAVGPIVASFDEYNDFDAYGGGGIVYRKTSMATFRGGHTLLIVGYDDNQQCWIMRNSWGPGWGDNGYALFGYGECKIDTFTKYGARGTNPDPWTRRRLHNGCFIESSNGEMHRNFELIRSSAPRARHLWRQGGEGGDFSWHEAATLENPNDIGAGAGAIGMPVLTSTTYGRNFETVYWEASGWLRHWWFDQTPKHWVDAGRFGSAETAGFPAFIQSSYGAPGNFEVVVRSKDGRLQHWWREGPPNFAWHDGGKFAEKVRMSGPSLVQSNVGNPGNLYLASVMDTGQMQLWWRDDVGGTGWHPGEVFGDDIGETPICMIQSQFGMADELGTGNFELCVAVNGQVQHWWRDNSQLASEAPEAQTPGVDRMAPITDISAKRAGLSAAAASQGTTDFQSLIESTASAAVAKAAKAAIGSAVMQPIGEAESIRHRMSATPSRWHHSATFGHDAKHVWGLLEGSFGFNLEAIVETTDGALWHYYRDGDGWHEGVAIDA